MQGEARLPDNEDMKDLLAQYEKLRSGNNTSYISEESFERIIDHFDEQDAIPKAIEAAEMGIHQYPYSASLLVKKADLMIASRSYKKALALLDKAEILDRNDIDIYILRTDAYLALDMQDKAVEILQEAIQHFEGDERIDLLFELADVYDDYEAFEKIFDCLKIILEYDPNNEEALYKICFWTDFTGRNEESIRIHRKIIDDFPYNDLAWFNLAAAYQGLRLYEKAIDAYQYAIVINEKFDYAYRNMADALMRLHRYKEAIEALERVIELARPEDLIFQAIAYCYEKIKNHAQARFYYRKASHMNPDSAKLYEKIARSYMAEAKYVQAIKHLETALRIDRTQFDFNMAMGECLVKSRKSREAVHFFLAAVETKNKNIKAWDALVSTLFSTEQYAEAQKQVRLAKVRTGNKPIFGFYEAAITLVLGKEKLGLQLLEEALASSPRHLKHFLKLYPASIKYPQVVELIIKFKRRKFI